jgi:hypothetical protein
MQQYRKYADYFNNAVREGKLTADEARRLKRMLRGDIRKGRGGVSDHWKSPEKFIEDAQAQRAKDLWDSGREAPDVELPDLKIDPLPDNLNSWLGDVGDMKLDLPDLDLGDLGSGGLDLPDLDLPD